MAEEKKEYRKEVVVRSEIPTQEVRRVVNEEERIEYEIISNEEALMKILNNQEKILSRLKVA